MTRAAFFFLLIATLSQAQISDSPAKTQASPPPPQSARQALIETFLGQEPNHLEKHLTEAAKKEFKKLDNGGTRNFLTEISGLGMQIKAGAGQGLQIMETGPILLSATEPGGRQKFEVVVERDDLVGEEDQIELSLRLYESGQLQAMPVIPRLTFAMKTESGIWRLNEVSFLARMPLGDEDFLNELVKNLQEKQQHQNEAVAEFALQSVIRGENSYRTNHPDRGFTCSLTELAKASKEEASERRWGMVDDELATGKKSGYVFALSGCDAGHFKAAAEPSTRGAGKQAFCTDESGRIKSSKDGKATTCFSRGEDPDPTNLPTNRVYDNQAVPE